MFDTQQFSDISCKIKEVNDSPRNIIMFLKQGQLREIISEIKQRIEKYFFKKYAPSQHNWINYEPPEEIGWEGELYKRHLESCWNEVKAKLCQDDDIYIRAYCGIIKDGSAEDFDYSCIRFAQSWERKVKEIIKPNRRWVGVHIRRTDHDTCIAYSPNSAFVRKMDEIIAVDDKVYFFVATDDIEVESYFKNRYGDRVVTQPGKKWGRDTEAGMRAGVIDLLCLAECETILGSYTSVYSNFAAKYKNKKLVICKEE